MKSFFNISEKEIFKLRETLRNYNFYYNKLIKNNNKIIMLISEIIKENEKLKYFLENKNNEYENKDEIYEIINNVNISLQYKNKFINELLKAINESNYIAYEIKNINDFLEKIINDINCQND